MKNTYLKLFAYLCVILIVLTFSLMQQNHASTVTPLYFRIDKPFHHPAILIDHEPVFHNGNIVSAVSLNTRRPIIVTVDDKSLSLQLTKLSKTTLIPIDIQFTDKKVRYLLQTLPMNFPAFRVHNKAGIEGYVLLSVHGLKLTNPSYSLITDMNGNIVFYRGNPQIYRSVFHLQKIVLPNGKIRYTTHIQDDPSISSAWMRGHHIIMDENFHIIDQVSLLKTETHDALLADEHAILMLDDGHYIVVGYNVKYVQWAKDLLVEVVHNVMQEQKDGKVLLDWNSEDFPSLQNACIEKCPSKFIKDADYLHINSLFIDPHDQNLIVSSASGYYIMKIHRKTGEILWTLGGKLNEFKNWNPFLFIRQHDPQILDTGELMMFDNHMRYPHMRKAQILRLKIDETKKEITGIYALPLNFTAPYMGSVQLLPDGNYFIGCGSANLCTARMIDQKGNMLWNIKAQTPYKVFKSYYYKTLDSKH